MKGKIAFVLGAAVGYVLGTRAGRERYEQIKRGAQQVWETEPVQRGVEFVKDAIDERTDGIRAFVGRVGADVFSSFAQPKARPAGAPKPGGGTTAGGTSGGASGGTDGDVAAEEADSDPEPAAKPATKPAAKSASKSASKPAAKRSAAKRTPKARP